MSDSDITDEIINLYADITNEEIINFAFLYDDKTTTLHDLEDIVIDNVKDLEDIDKIKLFYTNHLDLFVKNQNQFKNIIRNQQFLDEYMKYRTAFADIKTYVDSLGLYTSLSTSTSSLSELRHSTISRTPQKIMKTFSMPRRGLAISSPSLAISSPSLTILKPSLGMLSPSLSMLSPLSESTDYSSRMSNLSLDMLSPISNKSRFSGIFQKKFPISSIFSKIDPIEFSRICHKMYLCYYYLIEIREYQFYSRVSTREVNGYAREFSNFYDNFYRKLESEIEIFCESDELSLLADTFITLSTYFLNVGNIPLAQISINLMDRFRNCKKTKIKQFLDTHKLSLPLNVVSLKDYKKFSYLVDPDSINRSFITAQETANKIKTFSFIQTKLVKTKYEILSTDILDKPTYDDFIVFNYINPKIIIKDKQYKTSSPNGIDYLCIQQKCKSQSGSGSGFDKKHTKHNRKWSKEYCTHTSCNKMGFSQKASCRYYKNCYK